MLRPAPIRLHRDDKSRDPVLFYRQRLQEASGEPDTTGAMQKAMIRLQALAEEHVSAAMALESAADATSDVAALTAAASAMADAHRSRRRLRSQSQPEKILGRDDSCH